MSREPCPFEEEVLLLGDGELDFTRRVVVEAHLGLCVECAELEDTLSRAEECLVGLEEEPLGAVDAALERLPSARRSPVPLVLAGLAAAAGIAWLLVVGQPGGSVPEAPSSVARDEPGDEPPDVTAPGGNEPEDEPDGNEPDGPDDIEPEAPETPVEARAPDLPYLPPPRPREGPSLRLALLDLDPATDDYEEALAAVAERVRSGGARSASALARLLASREPWVTVRAMDVAELAPSSALERALTAALDVPELRPRAARLLGELRADGAVDALIAELDGPARGEARTALAAVGGVAASRALGERLWDAPEEERAAWLDAAVTASPRQGARLLLAAAATYGYRDAARTTLAAHGETVGPHVRALAAGGDVLSARGAMRLLGWARDREAEALLRERARSPETAGAATAALLEIGSPSAIAAAFEAARVGGPDSRAARALDGAAVAEPLLLEKLVAGDASEQALALRLLRRCGGEGAARALTPELVPARLHSDALDTLAAIGGDEAARTLGTYVTVRSLRRALVPLLGGTGSRAAVPALRELARDPRLAGRVAVALARIEEKESVELLLELLLRPGDGFESAAESLAALPVKLVVPALLERYRDEPLPPAVRRPLIALSGRDLGPQSAEWRGWWEAQP